MTTTTVSPKIYRLLSICRTPHPEVGQQVTAKLYHGNVTQIVEWWTEKTDPELKVGGLVAIQGKFFRASLERFILLGHLAVATEVNPDLNLFDTIPPSWDVDQGLRDEAAKLWLSLPAAHRRIFNEIFWSKERFFRYVTKRRSGGGQSSISHLSWVVRSAHEQLNQAVSDRQSELADLVLIALLLDAGSLEVTTPRSYVHLLEWLLKSHWQHPVLDDDLIPRLTWKIIQIHGLIEKPRSTIEPDISDEIAALSGLI